jgi:hypothetical protein
MRAQTNFCGLVGQPAFLTFRCSELSLKDGRYFEKIAKSDETHPRVEGFKK